MADDKPQVVASSSKLTDTVVNGSQQDVKNPRPTGSTKAINAYGISVMRGGNVLGTSFVDAILDAYSNIVSFQPLATLLMVISVFYYLSLIVDQPKSSPFHLFHSNVKSTNNGTKDPIVKSVTSMVLIFSKVSVDYSAFFASVAALSFPYFSKPSNRNATIAATLIFIVFVMHFKPVTILALSHLFFLLVQLRSPKHKLIIVILAIVICFISKDTFSTLATSSSNI